MITKHKHKHRSIINCSYKRKKDVWIDLHTQLSWMPILSYYYEIKWRGKVNSKYKENSMQCLFHCDYLKAKESNEKRVADEVYQPVFCIPAAMPFMVKMRVSSSPGAYSLVGLSFTSSAAGLESIYSLEMWGLSFTW